MGAVKQALKTKTKKKVDYWKVIVSLERYTPPPNPPYPHPNRHENSRTRGHVSSPRDPGGPQAHCSLRSAKKPAIRTLFRGLPWVIVTPGGVHLKNATLYLTWQHRTNKVQKVKVAMHLSECPISQVFKMHRKGKKVDLPSLEHEWLPKGCLFDSQAPPDLLSKSPWAIPWTPSCSRWDGWWLAWFPPPSVYECVCVNG